MRTLGIDIETYSATPIINGVYKYTEDRAFDILLFGYSVDKKPATVIDLTRDKMPTELIDALRDPGVLKTAFNAQFEITCLSEYLQRNFITDDPLDAKQWSCTMILATTRGYPLSLDNVAKLMDLDTRKDKFGKELIKLFTMPQKVTKKQPYGRIRPAHYPFEWDLFIDYCRNDVIIEQEIREALGYYELTDSEQELWYLDQKINRTGMRVDTSFAKNNVFINNKFREEMLSEVVQISGIDKPNSVAEIKKWIGKKKGLSGPIASLTKSVIEKALVGESDLEVKRMLEIRSMMGKTSTEKYNVMLGSQCADGRIKGMFQFYGANRTGRWAGRGVQLHNLPKHKDHFENWDEKKGLDLGREIVASGNYGLVKSCYKDLAALSSQLIRCAFIPEDDNTFIVSDFAAIEARVVAWLANEKWRLDVFTNDIDIYKASASQMFDIPVADITKELRQRGKVAELALGYQGGTGALIRMGALDMGLQEAELQPIVDAWRAASPNIKKLWWALNEIAIRAVKNGERIKVQGMIFSRVQGSLRIQLPSGRSLYYLNAKVVDGEMGPKVIYRGMNQTTKQWVMIDTYGGKLVENVTQAIARDCLADVMLRVDQMGYNIVCHVHDEIVIEVMKDSATRHRNLIDEVMRIPPTWARGTADMPVAMPIKGASFLTDFYKKD